MGRKTGKIRRVLTGGILAGVLAGSLAVPAWASAVSRLTITVDNQFRIGEKRHEDDLEITVSPDRAEIDSIEIRNGYEPGADPEDLWLSGDIPVVEITLTAEDGFSVKPADITVNGAKYRGGIQEDDQTLILRLELPSLRKQVGEPDNGRWENDHTAGWDASVNTAYYEVRLYRDGKLVGNRTERTKEPSFDFGSRMTREGNYTFAVRALNVADENIKSEWMRPDTVSSIDGSRAEQLRQQYGMEIPAGVEGPGQYIPKAQGYAEDQFGWIEDVEGWWYRNTDGSYTAENWQFIDNAWYYFNSKGYMVTGWIDWNDKSYYCDPETGAMLTSTVIQDGTNRRVGADGAWMQ